MCNIVVRASGSLRPRPGRGGGWGLLQRLPRGVGQEEAHEPTAGEQHGHDEGGRGAIGVQQRRDHHVANDAS